MPLPQILKLKLFILKMEFESCYLKCEITLPDIKSKSYNDVRDKIAELNDKYGVLHMNYQKNGLFLTLMVK